MLGSQQGLLTQVGRGQRALVLLVVGLQAAAGGATRRGHHRAVVMREEAAAARVRGTVVEYDSIAGGGRRRRGWADRHLCAVGAAQQHIVVVHSGGSNGHGLGSAGPGVG